MATGSGTQQDPYIVSTIGDVLEKCQEVGAYVCLSEDIYVNRDPIYKVGTNIPIIIRCAKFYSTNSGGNYKSIYGYTCIKPGYEYDYAFIIIGANTIVDHIGFLGISAIRGYNILSQQEPPTESNNRCDILCDNTSVITNCNFSINCGVSISNTSQPIVIGGNFENCSAFINYFNTFTGTGAGVYCSHVTTGVFSANLIDNCYFYVKNYSALSNNGSYCGIDFYTPVFKNITNSTIFMDGMYLDHIINVPTFNEVPYVFVDSNCSNSIFYLNNFTGSVNSAFYGCGYWAIDGDYCGVNLYDCGIYTWLQYWTPRTGTGSFGLCYKSDLSSLAFIQDKGLTGFITGVHESFGIPTPITNIDVLGAFAYCENLQNIELPISVTDLGDYAFFNSGLTTIKIPPDISYSPYTLTSHSTGSNLYLSTLENGFIDYTGNFVNTWYFGFVCDQQNYFDTIVSSVVGGRTFVKSNSTPACGAVFRFYNGYSHTVFISDVASGAEVDVPGIISPTPVIPFQYNSYTLYATDVNYAAMPSTDISGDVPYYTGNTSMSWPYNSAELATFLNSVNFNIVERDNTTGLRTVGYTTLKTGSYKIEIHAQKQVKITAFLYSGGMKDFIKYIDNGDIDEMILDIPRDVVYNVAFSFEYTDSSTISPQDIETFTIKKFGPSITYWDIDSWTCSVNSYNANVGDKESQFKYENCYFNITLDDGDRTITRRVENYNIVNFDTSQPGTLTNLKALFNGTEYPISGSITVV